ncbi:ABC transporter ATP-binding protein/permease [Clostridium sp. MSJ-11]|uniref:ABC transporter ATP-binding protein/permease n=2 Tax=Clostridium mobile TaxID=2841512 RepID=A0ABS6ELV9_9CLOT|nr:ABC transporter ATP-binding protein [Clostridium mobile]MBU5486013.1 ABC transporter ATP-binding protein/permease [Clostridium mobile]
MKFASNTKGKVILSVICSVISVVGGFIPYIGIYHLINIFMTGNPEWDQIVYWIFVCLVGYAIMAVFFGISTVLSHYSAYNILENIRMNIAKRLMKASLGDTTSKSLGYMKTVILDKVEDVEVPLAHMIPEVGASILLVIGVYVYLIMIDWRMALAALATIPIALFPMAKGMKSFSEKYNAYMQANERVNSIIVEYIEGIEVVKAFNQTTTSYAKFRNAVESFKDFTMDWYHSSWKPMNLMMSVLPSTFLVTVPVGALLYINHQITPTDYVMGLILCLGIISPLIKVTGYISTIKAIEYSITATKDLLELPELAFESDRVEIQSTDIRFEHVDFAYEKSQPDVFKDFSMTIPERKFTALVGPSGSGKSTIAKLIARYWDVGQGTIQIGNVDLKKIPQQQLADLISYVNQDNYLFDCSLMENIRLGKPDASDEEVYEAARKACCEEFISRLEKGYDTSAGEAGDRLSGGEKQRISIARAILKDAPIVILDEATASIDPENEYQIQRAIAQLTKGKTLVVIAHRLSTIKNADQIVVLNKGKIEAIGTQEELLSSCSLYQKMWKSHIGAKEWAVSTGGKEMI